MYYSNFKRIEHEICPLDEPAAGHQPTSRLSTILSGIIRAPIEVFCFPDCSPPPSLSMNIN